MTSEELIVEQEALLGLLYTAQSSEEMAHTRGLSRANIAVKLHRLYKQMGVSGRIELMARKIMSQTPAIAIMMLAAMGAFAQTTVTIVDQGTEPVTSIVGRKISIARLLDATVCNESDADVTVDNAMLYQRVNSRTTQALTLYDSQVVVRILSVFQDKDIYARLFRGGKAAATVAAILLGSKSLLGPVASAALLVGPQIYEAVLPVVHSPQDLQQLANDIVNQSTGGKLASHSCRAGLVIARTTAAVKTETLGVQ
jgi:DNA-binding CsgD family transcriptional regulator